MTDQEKDAVMHWRMHNSHPWHSPPHLDCRECCNFLVSAACYEHKPIIAFNNDRMLALRYSLQHICKDCCSEVHAWCILPNHYHLLVTTETIGNLLRKLGQLHGRLSRKWNAEEHCVGRKVWFNCTERKMKSERHYWATVNYIHHNPVRHGLCEKWTDWPFSSALAYLKQVGTEKAIETWKAFPILDYGKKWDY